MKDLINKAKYAYYNTGEPIMSDAEYDLLVAKYGEESVGAPVLDSMKKINISGKPMLSLNKCHTEQEVIDFAKNKDIVASIKCDGLSVRIIYENGHILSANTRGDGLIGQDITEHIKQFINVPLIIDFKNRLVVDGEAIIFKSDFDEINRNNEFKNPRNLAAGTLASLDTSLCHTRRLSFIAWDVIEGGETNSYTTNLSNLLSYGFTIVDYLIPLNINFDIINNNILKIAKDKGTPCDGVVWKFDNIEYGESLGRTEHHFNNGIAWKPPIEEYETELLDIEWTMGRTGVLTPVAIYKDIDIDGSTCNRASLHNVSIMEELLHIPFKGQKIKIFKANAIIPQVSWAEEILDEDPLEIPELCPICGGNTEVKESNDGVLNLYCTNPQCEGKFINVLDHFCGKKGLDIKGLSKMTLEKVVDWGWVGNIGEIFSLSNFRNEWTQKTGFGEKSVDKILNAIEESKRCTLDKLISSIGIPLVGSTVAKDLCKKFKSYADFKNAIDNDFDFTQFDGYGYEMNKALHSYDYSMTDYLVNNILSIEESKEETSESLKGLVFVITGKLSRKRDEIKAEIESMGGKVSGSVSAKTSYLICNDKDSTTGKSRDAKNLGVPIITEEEYIQKFKK